MAYLHDREDDVQGQAPAGSTPSTIMSGYGAGATSTPSSTGMTSSALIPSFSLPPKDEGPSATGYVNFDRFFNANEGAAKNTANQVAGGVANSAKTAQGGLGGVVSSFNQQAQAGTAGGPTSQQQAWAANGGDSSKGGTAGAPGKPEGPKSYLDANGHETTTAPNSGLSSTSTRNPQPGDNVSPSTGSGTNSRGGWVSTPAQTPSRAVTEDQLTNGAQGAYTGPTSLDVMSGYGAANDAKAAADDQLAATSSDAGIQGLLQAQGQPGGYSEGQSEFDAALTGAAGQQQFADERNQYGGLDKMFTDAGTNAQNTAQGDMATSLGNAGAYGALDSEYNANKQKQAADAPGFIPVAGGVSALSGNTAGDSTQTAGKVQQLGVSNQSGADTFVKGQGTAGSGDPSKPSFNYVGDQGSPNPSVGSDGTINMPSGVGKAGPDWGTFWGSGGPQNGSNWNPSSDPATANLTSAQWQNLAQMTPQQRAAWWAANHKS